MFLNAPTSRLKLDSKRDPWLATYPNSSRKQMFDMTRLLHSSFFFTSYFPSIQTWTCASCLSLSLSYSLSLSLFSSSLSLSLCLPFSLSLFLSLSLSLSLSPSSSLKPRISLHDPYIVVGIGCPFRIECNESATSRANRICMNLPRPLEIFDFWDERLKV